MKTRKNSALTITELEQMAKEWFCENFGPEYGEAVGEEGREIVEEGVIMIGFYSKKDPRMDDQYICYLVSDASQL